MGVGGQRHAPAALPQGRRPGTHYTEGWVGPRTGLDRGGKSRPPTRIRPPNRSARIKSLYQLRYPGPHVKRILYEICHGREGQKLYS
jgi:hypothetical protein